MEDVVEDPAEDLPDAEEPQELAGVERYAVYRCFSADGQLLYIGTSGAFGRRLAAHAQKIWFLEVRGITLEWYPDEAAAAAAERRSIYVEQPKYNVVHKRTRLRAVPGNPSRKPAAPPPVMSQRPIVERTVLFARALDDAPESGMSPKELASVSGVGRSLVYQMLAALVEADVLVRIARGCYRPAVGQNVEAFMAASRL